MCNMYLSFIIHYHCLLGYCKPETVDLKMLNPDSKCCSSVLREGCQTQQSEVLGRSQTIDKCADWLFQNAALYNTVSQASAAITFFHSTMLITGYHSILDLMKINSDTDVLCAEMVSA